VKLNHMNARALGSVAMAAMAVCAVSAQAAGEDTPPLSLKLSETVTYDSNYSRTTERRSEVTSSTGIEVGLNKPYGRQNYTGTAKFGIDKHKNVKEHDNQNYDVNLGFYSGIASRAAISANAAASRNLNAIQNNQLNERLAKNTRSYNAFGLDVQYGLAGRWVVIGSGDVSRTSYSLASAKYENQEQSSTGLKAQYNTSDLLSFGVGVSFVNSQYPNRVLPNGKLGEEVDQRSLSLSSNYQVTGFSSLVGVLSLTENKYKSDANAKFNGLTGRINWNYTPTSITSYTLTASRSTDDDTTATNARTGNVQVISTPFGNANIPRDSAYMNVTTLLNGTMRWTPTAKLGFNAGLTRYQYDVSRKNTVFGSTGTAKKSSSNYTVLSLGGDYQFSRAIFTACTYQYFKQSGESNPEVSYGNPRVAYQGSQVGCSASFKID